MCHSNKNFKRLIVKLEQKGWFCRKGKKHYKIFPPEYFKDKRPVFCSSTPSDTRAIHNFEADIKRKKNAESNGISIMRCNKQKTFITNKLHQQGYVHIHNANAQLIDSILSNSNLLQYSADIVLCKVQSLRVPKDSHSD